MNKPASLLKTWGGPDTGRLARYAVDGNNDTSNDGNCAEGDSTDLYNQWQVDLGDTYVIISVTLFVPQASQASGRVILHLDHCQGMQFAETSRLAHVNKRVS